MKLDILIWRIFLNQITTEVNIHDKGIDMDSILCPLCLLASENIELVFIEFPSIDSIWSRIGQTY